MIITFCGAQSTGKTTLLNYLSDRNPDFKFIPEVTRYIKRKYALPINEQGSILTQMMIMTQHVANAYNVNNNQSINVILDRCSIDGLIYTHWLCENGLDMSAYSFAQTMHELTVSKYDVIFVTSPEGVLLDDDGERSIDVDFRNGIIKLFDEHFSTHKYDNVVVLKGSVKERLQTIKETLKLKGLDISI